MKKRTLTTIIFFVLSLSNLKAQERKIFNPIKLFSSDKVEIMYIDESYHIYEIINGNKVGFLSYNQKENHYDLVTESNYKLGYWRDGIIFNEDKKVLCAEEGAIEKYMVKINADKGIESVLLGFEIQGWISLKDFLKKEKP